MLLEIDDIQRELLAELIQRELDDLGPEIHHTRTSGYREDLKNRRDLLVRLRERLLMQQPAGR